MGSHGDPMGSNLGIPGFPYGIPSYPLGIPGSPPGIPGSPPGIPGVIFIHPRDPWGVLKQNSKIKLYVQSQTLFCPTKFQCFRTTVHQTGPFDLKIRPIILKFQGLCREVPAILYFLL